jgi:hypothetical protein
MVVASRRIGLPDFDQHVAHRRSRPVENAAFDADALAFRFGTGEHVAEIVLEDIEAGLMWNKADMHVRAGRL